jgi:hypothetical protein
MAFPRAGLPIVVTLLALVVAVGGMVSPAAASVRIGQAGSSPFTCGG